MKKWLIIAGAGLIVVFITILSIWLWLMHTESGARFALARADGALERLDYTALSGSLSSDLVVEGFRLEQSGARVEAEQVELAVRIEVFNGPRVLIRHFRGRGIDVHPPPPASDEPVEPAAPFDLDNLVLPVVIEVEELDLRDLAIHNGDTPTVIERVELAGRYAERIEIERLAVRMNDLNAEARGEWALETRGSGQLTLETDLAVADDTRQSVTLDLGGRLDALDFELSSQGPARVDARGEIRGLPGSPSLETELTGALSGWPGLPVDILDARLNLSGEPDDWQATSEARVTGADIPEGRWSFALSGDTQSVTIESLESDILGGRIAGSGSLDWSESSPASQARLTLADLDLTPLYPDWPNQGRISGELVATSEAGRVEIERLDLTARPGELSVTGNGVIDPAEDTLDVSLEWRQFAWPPVTDERTPMVASESGRLRLEGRISDWRMQLNALIDSPQTPSARIEASAAGSAEHADIERLTVDAGSGGSLSLDGRVAWAPQLEADLALALDAFDPGVFVNQLPGKVDGRARIALLRDDRLRIDLGVDSLGGQLRGQSLGGSGRVAMVDQEPQGAELDLQLGDNRVAVDSADGASWEIDFEGVALHQLWPSLEGSASLSGTLAPGAREVDLSGRVENARYDQYRVEQASVNLALAWNDQPRVDLNVSASNFDLRPWDRIEQLDLTLSGNCDEHDFTLHTAGARGVFDLAAAGRLEDCTGSQPSWQGQLESLSLAETQAGDWQLASPLPLSVSAGSVEAGAACLATTADTPARLCLENVAVGETGRVVTRLEQVPVDLFLLPIDPVFSLTTPLSGRVEAGWDSEGLSRLDGQLQLTAGVLRAVGGERDLLEVDSVRLDLEPTEERALDVSLAARLEGRTEISGQARIADLRRPAETQLDGEARLDLPDIAAFAHLIPSIDRISGRATGRMEIDGPANDPSLNGQLSLENGTLSHAPLGLDVRAIRLDLSGSADGATLRGQAESGDGRLSINGEATHGDAGWALEATADGERFAFAGADWLQLTASPQLSVNADPDRVRIDGDIHIDRLRAGLPPGSADRVAASPDVEVVGEAEEQEEESGSSPRRVEGRLGIHLGDNARMAAAGLETELGGGIELVWNGAPRPEGRGAIRLPEGTFQSYGQTLEISDGEVNFTGNPVDNPRLDIRAVREIFGDPEVEAAGVEITGSAQQPEIELYTDPPTSAEKALAYVVTGSDFDHAGGQGALNVGFYLLPRLFVSYGVGLFEAGNVLSGRYEFSRRWGVRVVSGERDTGVDLSYTVNN